MENRKATLIEPDFKLFTKEQIIAATLQLAHEEGLPIALWRMPFQSEINLLVSFNQALELDQFDLQELKNGFALAPFNFNEKKGLFLQGDLLISFDFDEVIFKPTGSQNIEKTHRFKLGIIDRIENGQDLPLYGNGKGLKTLKSTDYRDLVNKCIDAIQEGFVETVVPARIKDIELPASFDLIAFFNKLCAAYENAFISFVSLPAHGSWLGATPEVLIERNEHIFRTAALAATQKYNPENSLSETTWNQKEIEEQAMVSRYIINCFKKIRLRDFTEKGPETVKAGNLLHLKTTLEVDLLATNFVELPTVMLELLHPTSAVAGMPKE